ncbi:alpha/beta fold hydrolase [Jiangella asiatica]|uniref:Alpha/beta fold hydrolase n=2 Tax=Jiangella asiatica TaxID=2530372 RepID=A0A4R5CSF3_9ACTN|nr:alpha/beta fold hydrolase [Jiangella asiatica]
MYDGVVERLPGVRVIRPDLRGFGTAPEPGGEQPTIDRYADDVAELLDREGVERAVVGGLSMGGYVTMAMLRRHPGRVAGVVLMDTKASADTGEARVNRERIAAAVLQHGTRTLRPMVDTLLGDTTRRERPAIVARVSAWLDAARPRGVAWAQRAMAARPASFDTLRTASAAGVPGAVVVGAEDTLAGEDDARAMAAAFQSFTQVHVIAAAGHLSAVENPDAVAAAVHGVLDTWQDLPRT